MLKNKEIKMRKVITIIIILICFLPVFKLKAASGLEVSPAINSLVLKPGETYVGSFVIKNNNEFNSDLEIAKGLKNSDNTISIDNFRNLSTNWVILDANKVLINSLSGHTFNYTINIPTDTKEGVYNPMFIFKLLSSPEETGAETSLNQLLPFQFDIFVSESGVYNGDLEIKSLTVNRTVLIGTDQQINFSIENKELSPTKPLIRIQIVSSENDVIYQKVENESLSYVLKDSPLSKTISITDAFKPDTKFGRYSVELLVTDTLTNKTKTERVYFWFIPQMVIFIIAIVLIFLTLLIILLLKIKSSSKVTKDKHLFMYK